MSDKKKPPTPPSPGGGLLFVNKNAKSSSFSRATSREEAAAINSYAQKWYLENNTRKGRRKAPPSPPLDPPPAAPPLTAYVSKVRLSQLTDDGPKPKRRRRKAPKKDEQDVEAEIRYDPQQQAAKATTDYAYSLPTPSETELSASQSPPLTTMNHLPGSSTDPFGQVSVPMTGEILPVLQYYISFTLVSTFNAHTTSALSPTQLAHSSAIQSIIAGCLNDKSHMYALLSATASRMRRVSSVPLTGSRSPEFFLSRAIGSIRQTLSTKTALSDKQTILDIFYLSVCEWYMHSYDAARTHFSFLRHFWKDVDPEKNILENYIHDMVSYNDIFLAVETGQPPFLDMKWEPEPLSEDRMKRVTETLLNDSSTSLPSPISPSTTQRRLDLGVGFRFMIQANLISPDLIQILNALPELMQIYHFTLKTTERCKEESSYLSRKSASLLHRLISMPTYGYELAITLPLVILLACMSTSAAWRAGKVDTVKIAQRLIRQLEYEIHVDLSIAPDDNGNRALWTGRDNRLLLWILITGLFAVGDAPEAQWFSVRARDLKTILDLDKDGVEDLLRSFVFLPSLQAGVVDKWHKGNHG